VVLKAYPTGARRRLTAAPWAEVADQGAKHVMPPSGSPGEQAADHGCDLLPC